LAAWCLTCTDQNAEDGKQPMKNKMVAMIYEDLPRLEKRKPFSLEEERANVFTIEKDEIGLLDIVILDAIAKSDACNR
jgi:hypothetical protein